MNLLINFWQLFLLSAPWLMLGLVIAGFLNVYLPADFLHRHLGKEGLWTTIKAAIIGAPMPLCSCGVIPAAIGLRRAGASKSATTAFLVSTPETGVDSISVSYVLLGPFMAIIRPVAAVSSAITAGLLVGSDKEKTVNVSAHFHSSDNKSCCSEKKSQTSSSCCSTTKEPQIASCDTHQEKTVEAHSCCASKEKSIKASDCSHQESAVKSSNCCANEAEKSVDSCCSSKPSSSSCCDDDNQTDINNETGFAKFKRAIVFSCNKLLADTMTWLMIGLFFAAIIQTYVPESYLSEWGSGILAMLVVILISIPMYICATASTPIAAGLLLSGVSPGAVLVFMLAGPATNIATLGVVGKELGKRALVAYLSGVVGVALIFGFLTDYLVSEFNISVAPMLSEEHQVLPHWLTLISGILLAVLIARLVVKKLLAKSPLLKTIAN